MQFYLVGGAVRDQLLGLEIKDRDWVVVGATADQMNNKGYRPVGKDFPVFLHPVTKEEYALARTERKSGKGYKGFQIHASADVTLEDDLLRRDLTINAIAMDSEGNLVDPYNGKADILAKIMRHVSPAFAEDPLRVLRVARFAARFDHLGFQIAPETLDLMKDIVSQGEMEHLVAERVWQETWRALGEKDPGVYFETLRSCGALKVLFPEIDALFGVPQTMKWHPEIDTGIHTFQALQQICLTSKDPGLRFAVLCHDLGKATTRSDILPKHHGHEDRGVRIISRLSNRLKVPKQVQKLAELVAGYHTHCHTVSALKPGTILKVLNALSAFRSPELLDAFILCCQADFNGRSGWQNLDYPQGTWLKQAYESALEITSAQFIEMGAVGKEISEKLEQARSMAIKEEKSSWLES